jgi:PhoH-like ATPase
MSPWGAAVTDALESMVGREVIDEVIDRGLLEVLPLTHIRGRSLTDSFVVIDEAQNLEPTTLRTILTRVGDGTKVVFTGDTSQIDAPYLGESNNALAVLTNAFTDQNCFGHITLTACERSDVASLAAELL